ncbi:MAG: DUF2202 domain-containing protein [Caldilineaceae bacterium]
MSKHKNIVVGLAVVTILALSIAACQPLEPARFGRTAMGAMQDVVTVNDDGITNVDADSLATALASITTGALTDAEADGLLFMREEEKLAYDVYVTLGAQWDLPIFNNISASETTHTDAVKTLLDRYNLDDPAADNAVGVFENPDLQALYSDLVAQGSQSLTDALIVGATIEDLDIVDLQTRIAQTERPDIQLVYENLMKGSRNHLRAFASTLSRQAGEMYQPQYLEQAAYDAIVNSEIERGGRGRGR